MVPFLKGGLCLVPLILKRKGKKMLLDDEIWVLPQSPSGTANLFSTYSETPAININKFVFLDSPPVPPDGKYKAKIINNKPSLNNAARNSQFKC